MIINGSAGEGNVTKLSNKHIFYGIQFVSTIQIIEAERDEGRLPVRVTVRNHSMSYTSSLICAIFTVSIVTRVETSDCSLCALDSSLPMSFLANHPAHIVLASEIDIRE